eukprot:4656764-Prorocentrum_lima.AAC.1
MSWQHRPCWSCRQRAWPDCRAVPRRFRGTIERIQQYQRAARKVGERPWNLHSGNQYLEDWTARNA